MSIVLRSGSEGRGHTFESRRVHHFAFMLRILRRNRRASPITETNDLLMAGAAKSHLCKSDDSSDWKISGNWHVSAVYPVTLDRIL